MKPLFKIGYVDCLEVLQLATSCSLPPNSDGWQPGSKEWSALTQGDKKHGFLIMPFDAALNWVHAEVIHASVAQGVRTRRADDSARPGPVVQQILDDIDAADVIFAVCTGKNANVFFELGYAWRHHTPILIAEDTHDLPFDLRGNRTALYGRKSPGADRDTLRFRLQEAIASVLAEDGLPRGRRLVLSNRDAQSVDSNVAPVRRVVSTVIN